MKRRLFLTSEAASVDYCDTETSLWREVKKVAAGPSSRMHPETEPLTNHQPTQRRRQSMLARNKVTRGFCSTGISLHWGVLTIMVLCIVVMLAGTALGQYSCGQFDYGQNSIPDHKSGTELHSTGSHSASLEGVAWCYYRGNFGQNCDVQMIAKGDAYSTYTETGIVYGWEHEAALGYYDGGANGPSPQAATEVTGFGVHSCLIPVVVLRLPFHFLRRALPTMTQ